MGFTFVDMFCGAGGSSWGARSAGGTLVGAIDGWHLATEVLRNNHPAAAGRILTRKLTANTQPSKVLPSAVDLLLASPECTHHSCARGAAPRDEESKSTANFVLNYASSLKPRWIVIENVVQMRSWSGYASLRSRLVARGYRVSEQVLDAADFGVPQTRRRLFMMCDRDAQPGEVRPTTIMHRPATDAVQLHSAWVSRPLFNGRRAQATLDRHLRAVERLGPGVPHLLVYYGSDGSGGWQPVTRPLRTLTTLDRFGLVTWPGGIPHLRMLQVDELKLAMGFPPSYDLGPASRRDRIRMLGNGVCPPVMQAIVQQLTSSERPAQVVSHSEVELTRPPHFMAAPDRSAELQPGLCNDHHPRVTQTSYVRRALADVQERSAKARVIRG